MSFDFPPPMMVQGEVISGGMKYGCVQQIFGVSWPMVPPTGWRYVAGKVKALLYGEGAICECCAEAAVSTGSCARPTPCAPVRMTIVTGRESYPLTDDLLSTYSSFNRFRLVATPAEPAPFAFAHLEVAAPQWVRTEPARRHELMGEVVARLKEMDPGLAGGDVRTCLWDGYREIPYPHDWARASADQGR
ncbi:hypothetical protein ACWDZ4_20330 [Streptomyces sp. NPDC003016]